MEFGGLLVSALKSGVNTVLFFIVDLPEKGWVLFFYQSSHCQEVW
jgi:hypothetical protein